MNMKEINELDALIKESSFYFEISDSAFQLWESIKERILKVSA